MKPFAFVLFFAATIAAAAIKPGDTVATVRNELGAPRGELARGDTQILVYERGEVELRNGVVTKALLRTPEEQMAYAARMAEENERARQANDERRGRLAREGEALKARKLADPSFISAPASVQLTFWEDFARAFPDVSVSDQLLSARSRYAAEFAAHRERRQQQEMIAELEERLATVEANAAAGPEIVAPISYPYYQYRRPRHPRHRDEPDYPVNFFPMQYPDHIGLGSSPPPTPRMPPVIGYDPLLPRTYSPRVREYRPSRPSFERRR